MYSYENSPILRSNYAFMKTDDECEKNYVSGVTLKEINWRNRELILSEDRLKL